MSPLRILHAHSTFTLGGKEARAVRLMNAFGDRASHTVLSAMPDALAARTAIDPAIDVAFPGNAPSLQGRPGPRRYLALARYMAGFDLVLSYNWGAMDVVMARRLYAPIMRLPPLIHHEDGFNADEAVRQKTKRVWFRRAGLGVAHALVVPSARLEAIAREAWAQPPARIVRIANGVPVARGMIPPAADAIPGFHRRPGETVVGTLAGLRTVKNLPRLVRAFAAATRDVPARLVIVGEGPERAAIMAEAARCGVAERLVMPGFLRDPLSYVGLFDIFALSSDSEQAPISLLEAMAAGLPAAATMVGDIAAMVAPANRPFVVTPQDDALAAALAALIADADLRRSVGIANRARALADHDEAAMIAHYRMLYAAAAGQPEALG